MSSVKQKKPRQKKAEKNTIHIEEQQEFHSIPPSTEGLLEKKEKAEKKPRVKKEKKPIQVVAVVTSDGIEGSFTPEPRRPLIVHFPFNNTEVKFNETGFQYDPSPPPQVQPYDGNLSYFQVNSETSSDENQIGVELEGWKMNLEESLNKQNQKPDPVAVALVPSIGLAPQQPLLQQPLQQQQQQKTNGNISFNYLDEKEKEKTDTKTQLLSCYSVKTGETFVPPATTPVQCFWCTHSFAESPCFLPVKEESGVYHVYGNYCTPQCALAFLLYEHLDSHVRWERMALLNRMYKGHPSIASLQHNKGRLYPAPPRESLVTYGGVYTIEQFRGIINENRVRIDVQVPPMVSILGTLDTKPIDFYDSSLQNTFTQGFSMDRFKAWSEQGGALRLKRSKPLKDHDSTLDACIQISVKKNSNLFGFTE